MVIQRALRLAASTVMLLAGSAAVGQASRQASYDAAQAAFDKGDWTTAAAGFEPLLKPEGEGSRSDGIIRSRYADALSHLGDPGRAEREARRALDELPAAGPNDDRAMVAMTLATIRHTSLDFTGAVAAYEQARAAATPAFSERSEMDIGEINAAMTALPQKASAVAEGVIGDEARFAAMPAVARAQYLTLAARARLNAGDLPGALAFSRKATTIVGASGGSVNIIQAQARGDAALIYLKMKRPEDAREALAYSGGGYMPNSAWINHGDNELPVCDDDLHPNDVAVVEFGVSQTGEVGSAIPVYASRPGQVGAGFARAIKEWSFDPQEVAKLASFWRDGVRVEVRCLTRPASTALSKPFDDAADQWLTSQGATDSRGDILVPPASPLYPSLAQRTGVRRRHPKGDLIVDWAELATTPALRDAPVEVRMYAGYRSTSAQRQTMSAWMKGGSGRARDLQALAAQADGAPGRAPTLPVVAWLLLEAAINLETAGNFKEAAPLLERVLATSEDRLDASDPVRLVATLHRALVDRKLGDAQAADARIKQAGLSAEQCSLFDVKPLPVNAQLSSSDFPQTALRWKMEGFVREAFDINAEGRVANVRTVLAYPAFVFGGATEKAFSRFRYLPPTLNDVALGCASQRQSVNYLMPYR